MNDLQLTVSAEERDYLVKLLDSCLKGDRVEMHHTDKRAYRKQIEDEMALVESLLAKLGEFVQSGQRPSQPGP